MGHVQLVCRRGKAVSTRAMCIYLSACIFDVDLRVQVSKKKKKEKKRKEARKKKEEEKEIKQEEEEARRF